MRFIYCPHCGNKLDARSLGDEGLVPWCETCGIPLFDMFSSCVIVLVVNEYDEAAVLRQNYLSSRYGTLVSGYMKPGETAEDCAMREVEEELGLQMDKLTIVKTWWHDKKDQLMIGFAGRASKGPFRLSSEVDEARWVPVREALKQVHPKGSISYALIDAYLSGILYIQKNSEQADARKSARNALDGYSPLSDEVVIRDKIDARY